MALYRTERRLSWHHCIRIGHWYAPWSQAQADTGGDYFSRTLRWLCHTYPKAKVISESHALPQVNAGWPSERFGLPTQTEPDASAQDTPGDAVLETEPTTDAPHAGDLLLVEWPQPMPDSLESDSPQTPHQTELPALWINGLERALRRHWQDNPLAEVIFIGGTTGICQRGLALAAHYGISVLDPFARLEPDAPDGTDHRPALLEAAKAGAPATLSPQGQEIWAGMLIGFLRQQVRYGPTPDPVSLPTGLWCR